MHCLGSILGGERIEEIVEILLLLYYAVLCQGNYDGFLCYFFYLIISFEINIQGFVNFQP